MPPAAEPAATRELPMQQNVAPMPPRLRPKPQLRTVGPGKKYPDRVAFDADLVRWHAERAERKKVMLVRRQSQQRRRHRADRIRPDNDNERRARQRKDKKRSVLGKIFQSTGRPALADLIARKKGSDEFEALDMWARYEVGVRPPSATSTELHASTLPRRDAASSRLAAEPLTSERASWLRPCQERGRLLGLLRQHHLGVAGNRGVQKLRAETSFT